MEQTIQVISNTDSSSMDSSTFGQSMMASSPLPQSHPPSSISGGNITLLYSQTESPSIDTCSSGWSGEEPVSNVKTKKPRKQIDRFDGLTEEEVMKKTLPDYLKEGLDIIIVGINPGLLSAHVGHHYAGPGNHFWACVTEVGLVDSNFTCYDDWKLVNYGIGFTNVCSRPTKGAADLKRKEIKEGMVRLIEKMRHYKPKIVVFNGKGIYESFVGHKNFYMGKQPQPLKGTDLLTFVMPSSSARCAQLPRAADKLPFYTALKLLRDHMTGKIPGPIEDKDVVFPDYTEMRVSQPDPKSLIKAERRRKLVKKGSTDSILPQDGKQPKVTKQETLLQDPSHPVNNINGRSALKDERITLPLHNGLIILESDKCYDAISLYTTSPRRPQVPPPQYQLPMMQPPPPHGIIQQHPNFLPTGHRFPFYFHPSQQQLQSAGLPQQAPAAYYPTPPATASLMSSQQQSPYFTNLLLSDGTNEFEPLGTGIPTPFSAMQQQIYLTSDEASSCSPPGGDNVSPYFMQNNMDEVLTYTTL